MNKIIFTFILFVFSTSIGYCQGIEWIREYTDGNIGYVEILSDQLIEYEEKATNSPPQLTILFPTTLIQNQNISMHINVKPLYRVEAYERLYEKSRKAAMVILYFTTLPDYKITTVGENLIRISWTLPPIIEDDVGANNTDVKFNRPVSLNFRNADIVDLLRVLAKQNNLNIIAGEEIRGEVTVSLTDVQLGMALDAILKVNKYDWFIQGNIIVIKSSGEAMAGELTTRVYKLDYLDASAVIPAVETVLTPKGSVIGFNPTTGTESFLGGGGLGGDTGPLGTGGSTAGAVTAGSNFGGVASSGAAGAGNSFIGGDYVLVTEVFANFSVIEDLIDQLDNPVPQINISVKFIETTLSVDERMGINWQVRSNISGPFDTADGAELPDGLNFGKWGDLKFSTLSVPSFYGLLEILSTDGETKLIQEPQVTVKNNMNATMEVGTTYPIIVPQVSQEGGTSDLFSVEETDIDISLNVKPRINAEKYISLSINATVQAVVGLAGPNADIPIISDRTTNTQVMIGDGETLLIGGLIYDQIIENKTTLPYMDKIPILKNLFTHTTQDTEQRELLIFITSNIIHTK
jgi:type IV pilus assembly protein PilQ